jgi:iron complex transport system substrate-binding protein
MSGVGPDCPAPTSGPIVSLFLFAASAALGSAFGAERIVCLGGPVTEIVFALGAGAEVVARDSSSQFPPETATLPDVGYFRTIGAEGVLAMRPTLVLAAHGAGPEVQLERLRRAGVRYVHLDTRPSAEATLAAIETIGAALSRREQAVVLAAGLQARLDQVAARYAGRSPPRVVFLLSAGGGTTQAAGSATAAHALIGLAGGANAAAQHTGYRALSAEALLALAPEVVLIGGAPGVEATTLGWLAATPAGRAGRVHRIDLAFHLSFGPRLAEAVEEVAAWLHPTSPSQLPPGV